MTASIFRTISIAAGAALLLHTVPAEAANKVWVSNAGADSGTCGAVTAPCATFQQAHDNVAAGGDIGVLTPGDYGPVTITKSVNITNDGVGEAAIRTGVDGLGVHVTAGNGDVVSLRGLVIDGQGIAFNGIQIDRAVAVHIQNCVIRNFTGGSAGRGVVITPSSSSEVFISDSIIYNNGTGAGTGGILVEPIGSGKANVVLDRVRLENNVFGLKADGSVGSGSQVKVRHSVVLGNAGAGIWSFRPSGGGASTLVQVTGTAALGNNGAGVLADGDGVVLLGDSTVEYNGTGASATNGGRLYTYGDNLIDNNVGEDLSPAAVARAAK